MRPPSRPAPHADLPHSGRLGLAWRVALYACLAVIAALAWMPGNQVPLSTTWDKLNHGLAFAALGFLAWGAHPSRRVPAFVALIGFGVLIEVVQWYVPSRSAEWADLVADAIGLAVGALSAHLLVPVLLSLQAPVAVPRD